LYSGERFDSSLNLYHLRARYYNMLTGRFETTDSVSGDIFAPPSLHKYVYTGNNPVNQIDPTGHDAIEEYAEIFVINEREGWLFSAKEIAECDALALEGIGGVVGGSNQGGSGVATRLLQCILNFEKGKIGWPP